MRKAVWVLCTALVASLLWSMWLWGELRAKRENHQPLVASLAEPAPASIASDTSASVEHPAAPDSALDLAATGVESIKNRGEAVQDDWIVQQRRLLKDPKYFDAQADVRRAQLADWRDDAVRLLGFTRKEADAVITAFVERRLRDEARDPPVIEVSPEGLLRAREAIDAHERAYQEQLRELVGEAKRARWAHYLESRFVRRQVDSLRSQLETIDALREDQVEPLISAVYEEAAEHQRQSEALVVTMADESGSPELQRRFFERQGELLADANRRKHAAAARILSPTQLKRFDELLQTEVERQQATQRAALLQSEIEARQPRPD